MVIYDKEFGECNYNVLTEVVPLHERYVHSINLSLKLPQ